MLPKILKFRIFSCFDSPFPSVIANQISNPWLIVGDFNSLAESSEKEGGAPPRWSQNSILRDFMMDCSLSDLGFKGPQYTWHNKQVEESTIMARLDRALANTEWRLLFEHAIVIHDYMVGLDHRLLVIQLEKCPKKRRRSFKYEAKWSREEDCKVVIQNEWDSNGNNNQNLQLPTKLHRCTTALIRCGNQVGIWRDKWIPIILGFSVQSRALTGTTYRLVRDLTMPDNTRWNLTVIN